jgi:hypothetical protein
MGDKYTGRVGRLHLAKEAVKEKWSSAKEEGGIDHTFREKANQVKEDVIRQINHGEGEYDHLYRLIFYTFFHTSRFHGKIL